MIDRNTTSKEYAEFLVKIGACQESVDWVKIHEKDCPTCEEIYSHADIPIEWKIWLYNICGKENLSDYFRKRTIQDAHVSAQNGNITAMEFIKNSMLITNRLIAYQNFTGEECYRFYVEQDWLTKEELEYLHSRMPEKQKADLESGCVKRINEQ